MTASTQDAAISTSPKLALFYDTETTGLPLYSEPSEDPRQPHIVQLAACLVDLDTRHTLASMDVIVRPEAWTIPAEAYAIHGITQERAMDLGISESLAVEMFMELWARRHRVGHNEQFDARILRIALKRVNPDIHGFALGADLSEIWKEGDAACTARMSTKIVKAPPTAKMRAAGRHHHKTPTLAEAYQHLVGKPLENAHSAMADVQGCMAVYFAVKDLQRQEAGEAMAA